MVLCFRLVTKTAVITHQCFRCCLTVLTQCQGVLCFSVSPPQRVGWACTRSWERTQLGPLTPTDQRDFPYPMTSRSVIKLGGGFPKQPLLGEWLAMDLLVGMITFTLFGDF